MAVTTTGTLTTNIAAAWNTVAYQAFTETAQFLMAAMVETDKKATPGSSVNFLFWEVPTSSTAALSQSNDGTPVTMVQSKKNISLVEYGQHVELTKKYRATAFGQNEQQAAWSIGKMAAEALDKLALVAFDSETGATWNSFGGTAATVGALTRGSDMDGDLVREIVAELEARNVEPFEDGYYKGYIHPYVLKDLKDETGNASWTVKELYTNDRDKPIRNEVGLFEGVRWIKSSRCTKTSAAGTAVCTSVATPDAYTTYVCGRYATGMAKGGEGDIPEIGIIPPAYGKSDVHRRFFITSWYALCGFGVLSTAAMQKAKTSASNQY